MTSTKLMNLKANLQEEIKMLNKKSLYSDAESKEFEKLNDTINPNDWLNYVSIDETNKKNELVQTARSMQSYRDNLTLKDLPTVYKQDARPPSY